MLFAEAMRRGLSKRARTLRKSGEMHNFLYNCPITGVKVQGSVLMPVKPDHYVVQNCPACGGFHLVDPDTGRRPSEKPNEKPETKR